MDWTTFSEETKIFWETFLNDPLNYLLSDPLYLSTVVALIVLLFFSMLTGWIVKRIKLGKINTLQKKMLKQNDLIGKHEMEISMLRDEKSSLEEEIETSNQLLEEKDQEIEQLREIAENVNNKKRFLISVVSEAIKATLISGENGKLEITNNNPEIETLRKAISDLQSSITKVNPGNGDKLTAIDKMPGLDMLVNSMDVMNIRPEFVPKNTPNILTEIRSYLESIVKKIGESKGPVAGGNLTEVTKIGNTVDIVSQNQVKLSSKQEQLSKEIAESQKQLLKQVEDAIAKLKNEGFSKLSIREKFKMLNEALMGSNMKAISVPESFTYEPEMATPSSEYFKRKLSDALQDIGQKPLLVSRSINSEEAIQCLSDFLPLTKEKLIKKLDEMLQKNGQALVIKPREVSSEKV